MYRFLKWVVWCAGLFFVFIIVAIIAVQIFLSSDEIIRIAEREGQKFLGRKVSIERLNLGFFKIEASGIVIDRREGRGKSTPFVRLDEVEILLNPSALIYKRISILQLNIKSASAHVHRDADGRFDFQEIIDKLNQGIGKTASAHGGNTFSFIKSAEAAESVPQGDESGFSIVIHELDLYDVKTELRFDAGNGVSAFDGSCSFSHIEIDRIKPGEPLDVFLDGKCWTPVGRQIIQLKGDVHINMKGPDYRVSLEMPLFDAYTLAAVSPMIPGYRFREGIFAGNLKFNFFARKPATWDVDLNGQNIHADFQMKRQAGWRKLILPGLKLKTRGRFDRLDGSARVETFFIETTILDSKLTKPFLWNVSARDEVHAEVNIRDMREVGSWISQIMDIPLPSLKESATARILVSAKRDRRISDDFSRIELDSRFDPVDLDRFDELIPPVDHVSKIKGKVGGRARIVFVSGERVGWDVALETQDFGAKVRMDKRNQWKALSLGKTVLHSRGNIDTKNVSASINTLEIKLPFAMAKLKKPAKWDVNSNDEAAFSIEVSDFPSANDFLQRLGLVSLGDVPRDAKLSFDVAVSRNRKTLSAFRVDANARFVSLQVAPLLDLAPLPAYVQKATGRVSGELQVSSTPEGAFRWEADIVGKKLRARTRIIPKEQWQEVSLESLRIQSSGSYLTSEGSSEIQTLDLKLPFARAYLNRVAMWNQRGRDEFSLTLDVTDLSAAEIWLGELIERPIKAGPKNTKLKISFSGTRNRKDGPEFSFKGSASFDPVQVSPWMPFVSLPTAFRNPTGEIAGEIGFSYVPEKKASWNLVLTSEDMRGEFLALMSRNWRPLRTGKFRVESVGSYDFQKQSGKLHSLNLNMPFGHVQTSRPVSWGIHGVESGRFQWTLSSLGGAARFAGNIWGAPVSEFSVAGSANGSMEISRGGKKTRSTSTKWSFSANLSSLVHFAYPKLKVAGNFSGQMDEDVIEIRIPMLKTINISKPNSEPDVILRNLSTTLDRSSILRGEIRSPSVLIKKLNLRYVRHEQGQTNFDSLLKTAKVGEKRTRRGASREKTAIADRETISKQLHKTGKKENGSFFPAVNIAKFEVARMKFHFQDFIATDKPPVVLRVPDARLSIRNLDTLMAPNLRKTHLEYRTLGESPSLLMKANLNPASAPPDADGIFNLSHFDLRKISPYIRDSKGESASALLMRGSEITRGALDFKSTYSLRKSQLNLDGKAKLIGLRMKPDETFPLVDIVVKLLSETVFRLFERPDDTIELNVRVTGRLDDPEFHVLDAIVEPLFVNLFEKALNLGGNVKDIVTGILGTAIEGVQKIVPTQKSSGPPPAGGARKEPEGEGSKLEQLGKKIEKTLQKGLRGLFGVK
ncbi:MAG: AsmA family protein [Nitrospinae bacterium]|nr:AsmA family protein [Nitrospinota bacterium]